MFKVIEGNVFLTDDQGQSLTTVSGIDGPILKVDTDLELTISGGQQLPVEITNVPLPVEEQNLDSEGYINNSAHNFGKIGANWSPFTLTDDGRLRIDIQSSPHAHTFLDLDDTPATYSGSGEYDLRVNSTATAIEFVPHTTVSGGDFSHFDLQDIGTITHSGIDIHIGDSTIHFPWSDVETLVSTASGSLQTQIDYYKYHGNLLELDQDHHPVYVPRDGSRGFTSTVSGIDPTEDYHLTTRQFVVDYIGGTASGIEPPPIMFFIEYVVEAAESSTNSTSYIQKARITASGIPDGYYRVGVSYFWKHSKLNTDFESRIEIDDTLTIFEYITSPYVDVDVWRPVSAFHYEYLVAGDHTIDFDFASSSNGSTSYVKEVSLELWRVE